MNNLIKSIAIIGVCFSSYAFAGIYKVYNNSSLDISVANLSHPQGTDHVAPGYWAILEANTGDQVSVCWAREVNKDWNCNMSSTYCQANAYTGDFGQITITGNNQATPPAFTGDCSVQELKK